MRLLLVLVLVICLLALAGPVMAQEAQPNPLFPALDLLALVSAFFTSWQAKTLIGLILLDVLLGLAKAARVGEFDLRQVANFYRTMIVPYLLGYLAFYVVIGYLIPSDVLNGLGDIINGTTVTMAWGALVVSLLDSIKSNFAALYSFKPPVI